MARDFEAGSSEQILWDALAANINTANGITVSIWAKLESTDTTNKAMLYGKTSGGANAWAFSIDQGNTSGRVTVACALNDASNVIRYTEGHTTTGAWTLWQFTWAGSNTARSVRIYKNGVECSYGTDTDGTGVAQTADRVVMGSNNAAASFYDGVLAEAVVWNSVYPIGMKRAGAGVTPTSCAIQPAFYAPLTTTSLTDVISSNAGTATGTTDTTDPVQTVLTGVAGDTEALVHIAQVGVGAGTAITNWRLTPSTGSAVASSGVPVRVGGLTNGVSTTFTLAVERSGVYDSESAASSGVTPGTNWVTDAFTRADAATLGASWKDIISGFAISSNKAVAEITGTCLSVWLDRDKPFARCADYSVSAKVTKSLTNNIQVGVAGRVCVTASSYNGYVALVQAQAGTDNINLYAVRDGVNQGGTFVAQTASEWTDGHTLTLEMIGNVIRVLDDGVEKISYTGTTDTDKFLQNVVGTGGLWANKADCSVDDFSIDATGVGLAWSKSGAPTDTTQRIAFGLNKAATVKVEYSTASNMSSSTTTSGTAVATGTNYTGSIEITGLTAGTTYYYRILINDTIKQFAPFPTFKTVATATGEVKFAVSSCNMAGPFTIANNESTVAEHDKAAAAVVTWAPDIFAHIGDIGYIDGGSGKQPGSLEEFRTLCRNAIAMRSRTAEMAILMRSVNTVMMFDDHEFINDFDGADDPLYFTYGAQAGSETYLNGNPDPRTSSEYYFVQRIRDVEFFFTDTRRYRSSNAATDNASKTILGATQKAALKSWLSTSTGVFKCIITGTSISPTDTLSDAWGLSFVTELNEILDYVKANGVSGVIWICGNEHANYGETLVRDTRTNYLFECSSFNITAVAKTGGGDLYSDSTTAQCFTGFTFDTSASPPTLVVSLRGNTNNEIASESLTLTDIDNNLDEQPAAEETGVTGGKDDNQRSIYKPTGLVDRPKKKTEKAVVARTTQSQKAIAKVRQTFEEKDLKPIEKMSLQEIDFEIGTLINKTRTEQEDILLLILMAASASL